MYVIITSIHFNCQFSLLANLIQTDDACAILVHLNRASFHALWLNDLIAV